VGGWGSKMKRCEGRRRGTKGRMERTERERRGGEGEGEEGE